MGIFIYEYTKLLEGSKIIDIDICKYTDIVDEGYVYVSEKFAWECAGYDWKIKGLNEAIDNGANADDISRKINRYDEYTFPQRKSYYDTIKEKKVFDAID